MGRKKLSPACLPIPLEKRFWKHVQKGDGCWEWIGNRSANGYGVAVIRRGKRTGAHRAAYALTHGPIPDGMQVCHRCDNPPCVRPDHLFLGSQQDNVNDMWAKGRAHRPDHHGEKHPRASLTWDQIRAIRELYTKGRRHFIGPNGRKHSLGDYTQAKLAKMFHVDRGVINAIVLGKNWRMA